MSTDKNNTKNVKLNRFAQIAKLGIVIFHTKDLANLWQIKNANTLHTTLKRYTKQGLLFRIYKGFYSIKPIDKLDPFLLGIKALHQFSYISAETVLNKAGIIFQNSDKITLVSSKSKKFSIGDNNYYSRKLADKFLYNPTDVSDNKGFKIAGESRAVADLLYFNPNAFFDNNKNIDWKKVKKIQKELEYPLTPSRY